MIKNVNKEWFKKKFKKIKLIAVTVATTLSVSLSSCGLFNNDSNKIEYEDNSSFSYYQEYEPNQSYETSSSRVDIDKDIPYIYEESNASNSDLEDMKELSSGTIEHNTYELIEFEDQEITFKDIDTSNIRNLIINHHVNYEGSEYFSTETALDRFNAIVEYESNSNLQYIINGKVDESKLRTQILKNNEEFMRGYTGSRYQEFSSEYFNTAFKAIVDTINKNMSDEIDVAQLDSNLGELKILRNYDSGNGYITEDTKILTINTDVTSNFGGMDFFYNIACHETNHLIQASSNEEKEHEGYSKNTGIYYEWDDLSVNALAYQWFVEGSAEKIMNVYNGVSGDLVTYQENIKTVDSITLSAIARDDVDELTIPKLSLQPNLNRLFEVFNCKTSEDKKEVVNMMFAFEIIYNKNRDFYNVSKISNKYEYEYSLYGSVAQTLTKNFYLNLVNSLSNGSEKLSNIFHLVMLQDADMYRLTKYNSESRQTYNKEFINFYSNVQREFFSCVAMQTGMTLDEVYAAYNSYYVTDYNISNSSLLDSDEISHLNQFNDSRRSNKQTQNMSTIKIK